MELMMLIGNDCIDTIAIERNFITFPGYVGHFVRLLKRNNEQLLQQKNAEPEFLLSGIATQRSRQVIVMEQGYSQNFEANGLKQAV